MDDTKATSMTYEVRAKDGDRVRAFGARRNYGEAASLLSEVQERLDRLGASYGRCWVEEIDTTGMFEFPSRPTPRERFSTRVELTSGEGEWKTVHVDVVDRDLVVAAYDRNYAMLQTFEPFRQGDRNYALISPHYTATAVLDLGSGEIVAQEEPSGGGFCPVGFYVPDWWDIHDGRTLPGSMAWSTDMEWPTGEFGFVWGCVWGDDSSWKVQYLDLAAVQDGVLRRDERFGYVELAAHEDLSARDFIRCWFHHGEMQVELSVLQTFDLLTGAPVDIE